MKLLKKSIFFFILFLSFNCYSQIVFEEGYFIDRNNQKTNCLIKNLDWKDNPTKFEYKISENSEAQTATIKNVKEFGIYDVSKYIRQKVLIDKTYNDDIKRLTKESKPVFLEEEPFLKVLVEGKASLYSYVEGRLRKYFYSINDSKTEQLIFKNYIAKQLKMGTNNTYKQQLFNDLKCPTINKKKIERLQFKEKELIKFFIEYNECYSDPFEDYTDKQERNKFNLNIRPGLNITSLSVQNYDFDLKDFNFDNEIAFRFGIEAEYILPFNKNKWAVAIEPTYQSYKSKKTNEQTNIPGNLLTAKVKYNSIEIPATIRHYFYLNSNSKLFINASFILDLGLNSSLELIRADDSIYYSPEISTRPNYAFGVGYKSYDKYSIEIRYQTGRNILANFRAWDSQYHPLSVILGYTLF